MSKDGLEKVYGLVTRLTNNFGYCLILGLVVSNFCYLLIIILFQESPEIMYNMEGLLYLGLMALWFALILFAINRISKYLKNKVRNQNRAIKLTSNFFRCLVLGAFISSFAMIAIALVLGGNISSVFSGIGLWILIFTWISFSSLLYWLNKASK